MIDCVCSFGGIERARRGDDTADGKGSIDGSQEIFAGIGAVRKCRKI